MSKLKNKQWILLYIMLLATTIIYSFSSQSKEPAIIEPEKITITFRHVWTKPHDQPMLTIFQDVVDDFEQSHPNVKVNFEGLEQTNHREQKLKSEMVTGTPPDMFVLFGGAELDPYVRSNRLLDLSQFVSEHALEFIDISLWTYDNGIFGLPFEGHAQPLFYNKKIFNELGLEPPTTIDELNTVISALKSYHIIPFAFGNQEIWPAGIYAHYLMDRYEGPEHIKQIANGSASFQTEGYQQAFDQIVQWVQAEAFNELYSELNSSSAIQLFNEGKAAMYVNGNWDISLFQSPNEQYDFQQDIGVIPFPSISKEQERSIAGGYTIGIGLSANLSGAQQEAALQLLQAIYTEEVQQRIVYEAFRLPSMAIPFDINKTGPVFAQVVRLLEKSDQVFLAYDNTLSPEVRKAFWTVTDSLFKLEVSSDEALMQLDEASKSYYRLINSYGGDLNHGR